MKYILMAVVALNLVACASYFKRKECESTNWFEHGKGVALRGEWLNSDKLVGECRKVEAEMSESQLDLGFKNGMQKYCTADNSYKTGKNGDAFSRDLCEGPEINMLIGQYRKGINDYCAKTNGQTAGASGKKYQNVCPKELEPAFLVEYRKGRKRYVQSMIDTRQEDVRNLESKIYAKRGDLNVNKSRLSSLESQMSSMQAQKSFTPADNFGQHGYLDGRISALSSEVSTAKHQVTNVESELSALERERSTKVDEISSFKAELPSLEAQ
jgi:hypothetical protein